MYTFFDAKFPVNMKTSGIKGNVNHAPYVLKNGDFDSIFSFVKKVVKENTGRERAGIGLAIGEFNPGVAAYWQVGSNYLVMNGALLRTMSAIAKNADEFSAFVTVVLMHEYIHSIGFIDETEARSITRKIVGTYFGENHPAVKMASGDMWDLYPQLLESRPNPDGGIFIVPGFATEDASYFA